MFRNNITLECVQGAAGEMRITLEQNYDAIYDHVHDITGIIRKVCLCRIWICAWFFCGVFSLRENDKNLGLLQNTPRGNRLKLMSGHLPTARTGPWT